jgi:hypothetical protein
VVDRSAYGTLSSTPARTIPLQALELRILKRRKTIPGSVLLKYFRNIAAAISTLFFQMRRRRNSRLVVEKR